MVKKTKFNYFLEPGPDRLFVSFWTESRPKRAAKITRFHIRYQAVIDGRPCNVIEFDNCHGSAHEHRYDRAGNKGGAKNLFLGHDTGATFRKIYNELKGGLYKIHRDWYIHQ